MKGLPGAMLRRVLFGRCVWGALGGYAIALLDSDEAEEGAQ